MYIHRFGGRSLRVQSAVAALGAQRPIEKCRRLS